MQYNFVINDFEGPLDLLLHLIKTSKMEWNTVSKTNVVTIILIEKDNEHTSYKKEKSAARKRKHRGKSSKSDSQSRKQDKKQT